MLNRVKAFAGLIALLSSTPVLAEGQTSPQPARNVPATNTNVGDPNEKICEKITIIGSRLATKRFCGTRAEWEDRRRQDREAVEAAQRSPCVLTHNSGSGRPSC